MKPMMLLLCLTPMVVSACAASASGPARARIQNWDPGSLLAGADINRDGRITRYEFVDSRGVQFDRFDRNHDGYIDRSDAPQRPGRSRRRGHAGGLQEGLAALRAQFDRNGDGRLSRLEFTDGPTEIFDRADANGDAVVDASELAAFRQAIASRRPG